MNGEEVYCYGLHSCHHCLPHSDKENNLTFSLPLTLTHTYTHTHAYTLTDSLSLSLLLYLRTKKYIHSLYQNLFLSVSFCISLTISFSLPYTLKLTLTWKNCKLECKLFKKKNLTNSKQNEEWLTRSLRYNSTPAYVRSLRQSECMLVHWQIIFSACTV